MVTTTVTSKGQIVIPSKIRRHLNIKKGTRLCITEKGNEIVLQPLTEDYFEKAAGILKTKGKLTRAVMAERKREREKEDRKWLRS